MSHEPLSIAVMFDRESLRVPELVAAASKAIQKGAQTGAAAMSPAFWGASAQRVVDLVEILVDVSLKDVLVGAWKVNRQFTKYTDPATYPPEKVSCVELLTHHIKSSYEPYVELVIDGASAGKVTFSLELDVCVQAGIIVIQAGRIRRLEPGKCHVTATLKCEGEEVAQRKSQDFSWTDGISFGEGIPIARVV